MATSSMGFLLVTRPLSDVLGRRGLQLHYLNPVTLLKEDVQHVILEAEILDLPLIKLDYHVIKHEGLVNQNLISVCSRKPYFPDSIHNNYSPIYFSLPLVFDTLPRSTYNAVSIPQHPLPILHSPVIMIHLSHSCLNLPVSILHPLPSCPRSILYP